MKADRRPIQYGHLAFLVVVAGYATWRLVDARAASSSFQNLLLIEPIVFVMLALVAVIGFGVIVRRQGGVEDEAPPIADLAPEPAAEAPPVDDRANLVQVGAAMALTAVFLALIPPLGLDVATFLFVAAALFLQGERRPWMIVLVPAVFAFAVVHGFKALLPTPIPTFFG